jgi:hypothetical protein
MIVCRILGYKDFFRSEYPVSKEEYATKVGKDDIQRLSSLMLTYCKMGLTPSVDELIAMWFQYEGKSYQESIAYHHIINEYRRIVTSSGHNSFSLLNEEALLNMYIWATENKSIPESIQHKDGSFMVSLFMLYLLFNDDVLANVSKAVQLAKQAATQVNMRIVLAQAFPVADISNIEYGKLIYAHTYKLMELLNYLESSPKYLTLYQHLLKDFGCNNKEDFFKALGGAVIIPLNPLKSGINILTLNQNKQPEKSKEFLDKLVLDPGDINLGPTDYKILRDSPLQLVSGEYRVVYELFLVKKLYNGILFKLSEYVNKNIKLLNGSFFGEIRNDFSEGVLLYNTMAEIFKYRKGIAITGQAFKNAGVQREPDYYFREDQKALFMESKDFFMPAKDKLSYDFDTIVAGLKVDGRLGKAVLQIATNVIRALKGELILDNGYNSSELAVYPTIVVHDSLYNSPSLNYWVNEWFQVELKGLLVYPDNEKVDILNVRPITLIDIDTLILYRANFQRQELDLIRLIDGYQQFVQFDKVTEVADLNFLNATTSFSIYVDNEARNKGIIVDLAVIEEVYHASGYVD